MAVLLDPTGPVSPLLPVGTRLSQGRVHQQAAVDPVTGEVYVTQVVDGGRQLAGEDAPVSGAARAARGDLAISRVSPDGDLLGSMYVRRFDHGSGLGVEWVGEQLHLWTGYDAAEVAEGRNAHGRLVARFPFQDGAVLDVGAPEVEVFDPVPGARSITPGLDLAHGQVGARYSAGGELRYRVWSHEAFVAHEFDDPLWDAPFPDGAASDYQAWTLFGEYIYQHHGTGYSDSNPGGNARFVIVSLRTGTVVRNVPNEHHEELEYREAEAIGVLASGPLAADGPRLFFGFAVGAAGERGVALYATEPEPGPGTFISAVPAPSGAGIELTVAIQDPASVVTWRVTRPGGHLLFAGTGAEAEAIDWPSTMLDTAPPRCTPTHYVLTIERVGQAPQTLTTEEITYTPPGGCGTVAPVAGGANVLGCAGEYAARVHWRGGALELPLQLLDDADAMEWSRTERDVADASVTIPKGAHPDCCTEVQQIHPWVHELSIYRADDRTPIWQGPITRVRSRRGEIVIEAQDVTAWLEQLVNTYRVGYTTATPDAQGRRRGTIAYIAANHLRLNMIESALSDPADYAGIMQHLVVREDGLPTIKVERDGSTNDAIWTVPMADAWREWTKRGLTWTTVGRSIVLRGSPTEQTIPQARLTMDDFAGDVEIIRDGLEAATYAFATTQRPGSQDISEGVTVGTGRTGTPYGRLDRIVVVDEDDPDPADLERAAREELSGRYPAPMVISMPADAQLAPDAPITVRQLVPGERIDVTGDECWRIQRGFRLTDVRGVWQSGVERISIGLVPLGDTEVPTG
ncbi:hypothetical protein [Streptomyces sp. NBRC 109706]|uniref:phage baseplate protein n=1 Tax=Streptomyces sp. NBRC 109706 TaxID=1550035 RepID=UPI00078612A5|nr:hypothetical protein [Streptomyces sp. NBRC 109706]